MIIHLNNKKKRKETEKSILKKNVDIEQKIYDHFGVITFTIIFMFTLLII